MSSLSISHWADFNEKTALHLFAQAMEELLSAHSHDSHRVPALNFHYVCIETLEVIALIENDVVDKGNLIPLVAEMRNLFVSDTVAQKILGSDFESLFSRKNSKGCFERTPLKIENSSEAEKALPLLKRGLEYIAAELGRNNQYFEKLTHEIKSQVGLCGSDLLKLDDLRELIKIVASELINKGYNQSYIYERIIYTFFDHHNAVMDISVLDNFFNYFTSEKHKYVVYLPLNSPKQKKALENYGPFEIEENVFEMFAPDIPYILKFTTEQNDPYNARKAALALVNFCLSINHFIKHNQHNYNPKYSEVVEIPSKVVSFIRKPEDQIYHSGANCEDMDVNELLSSCLNLNLSVFQALQQHSAAMISKNTDNQLINLWTAFEVSIPVMRKDGLSRVNQISNA